MSLFGVQFYVTEDGEVFRVISTGMVKKCKTALNSDGYAEVSIRNRDKEYHKIRVHKPIALAYIPNPNGYPSINHKDEDKLNNHVENLEWCTVYHNNHWNGRCARTKFSRKSPSSELVLRLSKPVAQIDPKTGNLVRTFRSAQEAMRLTGIDHSAIARCCRKVPQSKTAGGYEWRFMNNENQVY